MNKNRDKTFGASIESVPIDQDTAPETGFRHSTSYHDFFRGYTEVKVPKKNGKYKIQRIYTADWVRRDIPEQSFVSLKIIYGLLFAGAWISFVWSTSMNVASNLRWFVVLPVGVSLLALFLASVSVISWFTDPRDMTYGQFHNGPYKLKSRAMVAACALMVTSGAKIISMFVGGLQDSSGELGSILLSALSAALISVVYLCEKQAVYVNVPNNTEIPKEGDQIW